MIHHGAFAHLAALPPAPLEPSLAAVEGPVVLFFGLLRPYKGLDTLLEAWRGVDGRRAVDRRAAADGAALARSPPGVRFVPRFVSDAELAAFFRRADIVVLPVLADRAAWTSRACSRPRWPSAARSWSATSAALGEVAAQGAARLVAPDDAGALRAALVELIEDPGARERARGGRAGGGAAGRTRGTPPARQTLALYRSLGDRPTSAPAERRWHLGPDERRDLGPEQLHRAQHVLCATAPTLIWPM